VILIITQNSQRATKPPAPLAPQVVEVWQRLSPLRWYKLA